MKWPKLKNPGFCRLLTYVVVLGSGALPALLVSFLPVSEAVVVIAVFVGLIGILIYMIRNFMVLMAMDVLLALLCCHRTAREQYVLPPGRTAAAIRRSVLRYGAACTPKPIQPQPSALRYRFSSPMTVYSRGIERVIAAYEVERLDRDTYYGIFHSAKTNSAALAGRRRALFLDKTQKKQKLHRVTVVLILAHQVDPTLADGLYELVCKQCGDENEDCVVPCVVDLEKRTCVFNCVRVPYVGFGYAVKNRGIRVIKYRVFGGNLNLGKSSHFVKIKDYHPEDSLWKLWGECHREIIGADRKIKKRFGVMADRDIRVADGILYLKWDQCGICQEVEWNEAEKRITVEALTKWAYPKVQLIGKKTVQKMEAHILSYCAQLGYAVEFVEKERTER